ncbi:MAG TPA: HupE/UreJ family protein [Solimonas sp.]|nr:HupE/UreJ family protein [Solimonas sp.]
MRGLVALLLLTLMAPAQAHRPSDAEWNLELQGTTLRGHWTMALRDLEGLADLDRDGNRRLTWGELRRAEPALAALVPQLLSVQTESGEPCELRLSMLRVQQREDGGYAWMDLDGDCPRPPRQLALGYAALFPIDPSHRGLLQLRSGEQAWTAVFAPEQQRHEIELGQPAAPGVLATYLREGVHHIWIGYDHLAFLLVLLLPAVLRRQADHWQPVTRLREALVPVVGTVTAFTVAHSITLVLSVLDLLRPPTAAVELAIAGSVLLAALNNLWPILTRQHWRLAFLFGLLHGFGFAAALQDLGLPTGLRGLALLGFNLGVELGQLAVVAVFVPLAFMLRNTRAYRLGALGLGSLLIAVLAAGWLLERAGLTGS